MRILLTIILSMCIYTAFGQYELNPKESCEYEIEQDLDNIIIAHGSPDCVRFKLDTAKDYTLLVFNKENEKELLYQGTILNGQRQGIELIYLNEEKVIFTVDKGILNGESIVYYSTGEIKAIRKFRKGKIKKNQKFSKDGKIIN
ncbi:MAG: hypothetical protein RIC95_09530 [Vicingaceae bacterium]